MTCQRRSGYLWQRHRGVPGLATEGTRGRVRRFPCSFGLTGGQSEREIRQHSFNIPSCVDRLPHSIQQIVIACRPPQRLQPLLAAPVPEISRTTTTHPFAVKLGPTHWPASTRLRLAASERALGASFQALVCLLGVHPGGLLRDTQDDESRRTGMAGMAITSGQTAPTARRE